LRSGHGKTKETAAIQGGRVRSGRTGAIYNIRLDAQLSRFAAARQNIPIAQQQHGVTIGGDVSEFDGEAGLTAGGHW
jgi:hypothetical protein